MCRGMAFVPSALTDWIVVFLTPSDAAVISKDRTIDQAAGRRLLKVAEWI